MFAEPDNNFGVQYTVVRNLTGVDLWLSWYPTGRGFGITLARGSRLRFSGNLLESVLGLPEHAAAMRDDIALGRIVVETCGDPLVDYELPVSVSTGPLSCGDLAYDSSSSLWRVE